MKVKPMSELFKTDGPSFGTFLTAKSALLRMNEAARNHRIMKHQGKESKEEVTLTASEITALYEVIPELTDWTYQFSV